MATLTSRVPQAIALAVMFAMATTALSQTPQDPSAWKAVEDALGRKGQSQPGDVYKFAMPRSDLKVTVAGTPIKAGLALGSWAAFKRKGSDTVVMGDLVLTESEVGPVMSKLQDGGIEQTAVHNHVLNEQPRVMYMHIRGHGDAAKLARTLHEALALTGTPAAAPPATQPPASAEFDTAAVARALGREGKLNNGIYQISVARPEKIMEQGMEVPPSMGVATAINFQPTGGGKAAITGDFVLLASEVNPVIRALRSHGIAVTALHSHMLDEEPRLFFMHFWANDDAVTLAQGLKAALEATNSAR